MAITLRSAREIELIRSAGAIVADVLLKLQEMTKPGVTTGELDAVALDMAAQAGAEALFKGVRSPHAPTAFSGAICASINEQVVHGIPSADVVLKEGDVLSIDFGVRLAGYCGDAAVTIGIGEISQSRRKLLTTTREVLELAIANCAPSVKWSYVAGKMQEYTEAAGFSVVKDFVGHGIGREMHEEPRVPNFVNSDLLANDFVLERGMILAVEPMVNEGRDDVRTLRNGWTVVTKDSKCSAHFEHTIVITDEGCEILTRK